MTISSTMTFVGRPRSGRFNSAKKLFSSTKLVSANVEHSIERTREVIAIMEPLRQTWHEAAAMLAEQSVAQHTGTRTGDLGFA